MADTLIDASAVRDQQRSVWDGVCAGWERWRADFERGASVVTQRRTYGEQAGGRQEGGIPSSRPGRLFPLLSSLSYSLA